MEVGGQGTQGYDKGRKERANTEEGKVKREGRWSNKVKAGHSLPQDPKWIMYWPRRLRLRCAHRAATLWNEYSCHVAESKQTDRCVKQQQPPSMDKG